MGANLQRFDETIFPSLLYLSVNNLLFKNCDVQESGTLYALMAGA